MNHRPLHLHSMMVHGVVAFAPLAALSLILEATGSTVGPAGPDVWAFLLRGSLIMMLALAVPSTLTGITERNHLYADWPPSHRAKLALSLVLVTMLIGELLVIGSSSDVPRLFSWLGFAVVVGNCVLVFGLSFYGLKITLGRQAIGRTSYLPDMDWDPPMDILSCVADYIGDPPKMIDVQGEHTK